MEALNGYFAGTSDMDAMQIPATGENIPTAMATAESDAVTDSPIPATPLALEGDSTVDISPTRDSEITMRAGGSSSVTEPSTIPTSSSIQQAAMNRVLLGQMGNSVTDVEIGGGKIQGCEIIPGRGRFSLPCTTPVSMRSRRATSQNRLPATAKSGIRSTPQPARKNASVTGRTRAYAV